MHKESLHATDYKIIELAQEVMPGDPAHVRGIAPDPAFSDEPLNKAAVETVGKMDQQGIGGGGSHEHNSGNLTTVGPVDRNTPESHNSAAIFGGGFGRVS